MTPQSEPESRMSELGRLTNVFFEPSRAFADIAERPRPWAPLAVSVVMALVFMIAFSQRVGWERFAHQTMESAPQMQNMPPEQRERAVAMQLKIMPVMGYVGAVLGSPVTALVVAGVLLLMFKVFMGAGITFKQMFGITAYSFLPGVVGGIAAMVVMFLKDPDEFNLQNPTAFNLGAFFNPESTAKWKIAWEPRSISSPSGSFCCWPWVWRRPCAACLSARRSRACSRRGCLGAAEDRLHRAAGVTAVFDAEALHPGGNGKRLLCFSLRLCV